MMHGISRCFAAALFVPAAILFAQSPATPVSEGMREFMTTLEELSKSTVLRSDDSYFVNDLFLSIVRQNPSILAVAKTTPDGVIVNRVTPQGVSAVSKKVSGERWFTTITSTRRPYLDVWTETSGKVTMLCAWPLIDDTAQPYLLTGVFSVKINVRDLIATLLKNENAPVSALYGATRVFSQAWREGEPYSEEVLPLTKNDRITVRYQENIAGTTPAKKIPDPLALNSAQKQNSSAMTLAAAQSDAEVSAASPERGRKVSPYIIPSVHPTALTDSFLYSSDLSAASSAKIIVIIVLAVLTLIAILVSLVALIRLMPKKREVHAVHRILSPGPIDAIMVPDDSAQVTDNDTGGVDIASAADRETRELPALRELITESSRKLKFMDSDTDPVVRARVLKEINENLSLWVSTEIGHLTGHLASLSESIRACEAMNGQVPELQVLRYEIERIIEELYCVDRKIPHEIFS